MEQWRGTIVQLACLAALVAIVGLSKSASTDVIHIALGAIATVLGQSVARARVDAVKGGSALGGSGTPSKPPPGLTALVGALVGVFWGLALAMLLFPGVGYIAVVLNR